MSVKKYDNPNIIIGQIDDNIFPNETKKIVRDLDLFEKEINQLSSDLAKIDESIRNFRQSYDKTINTIEKLGNSTVSLLMSGKDNSNKVKGAISFLALAFKGGERVYEKQKKEAARAEYEQKRSIVLNKKKEIAETKLPHITKTYIKFKEVIIPKIEELFDKEFEKKASLSDPLLSLKTKQFKQILCITVKERFLEKMTLYCIEEMNAWIKGKHDSSMLTPTIDAILSDEITTWKNKLSKDELTWDEMISIDIKKNTGEMAIPIITLLSLPTLLRNYVGINIGVVKNCPDAIIQINNINDKCYNRLVSNNEYYIHCKRLFQEDYKPPRKPRGFSIDDLFVLLLVPLAFFGLCFIIFKIESSSFWRIFFLIPSLCWLGYFIERIEQNFDSIFPYINRIKDYEKEYNVFCKEITKKEDCQEFHIL